MTKLECQQEYEVTCQKLLELQQLRDEAQERQSDDAHVKELTLRSLGRLIKQLQEEKIWYECHACARELIGPAVVSTSNPGEASATCMN